MYILKNAFRSITRSKGRNILIGIIILVISVSACVGLSIRQAAENAKEETLAGLTVTASISVDRSSMMSQLGGNSSEGGFDKNSFKDSMNSVPSLTLDELQLYADLDSVASFYYSSTVSFNGSDNFEAVSTTDTSSQSDTQSSEDENTSEIQNNMQGSSQYGGGFTKGFFGTQGDFTVIGYSSYEAMSDFINGTCTITTGSIFEEGENDYTCIISDELATYNELTTGDVILVANPNDEEETYELTITGIYHNDQSTVTSSNVMNGFSSSTDPANQIYVSYETLDDIVTSSNENATISTDENTGNETTTALPSQEAGTYVFASVDDYEVFATDVYDAGLSDNYIVSSSDVTNYENSLLPLENLSDMAMYFLIIVLVIGAIVLIVLNIFSVRERKYEVGVLTAIGMKKLKVSLQFILESFIVTIAALIAGAIIGAAASVPVTNSLLASQIEASNEEAESMNNSFGKDMSDFATMGGHGQMMSQESTAATSIEYVSNVTQATDLEVFAKLLLIGLGLTLVASAASIIFIMRYDPLKILANRD